MGSDEVEEVNNSFKRDLERLFFIVAELEDAGDIDLIMRVPVAPVTRRVMPRAPRKIKVFRLDVTSD